MGRSSCADLDFRSTRMAAGSHFDRRDRSPSTPESSCSSSDFRSGRKPPSYGGVLSTSIFPTGMCSADSSSSRLSSIGRCQRRHVLSPERRVKMSLFRRAGCPLWDGGDAGGGCGCLTCESRGPVFGAPLGSGCVVSSPGVPFSMTAPLKSGRRPPPRAAAPAPEDPPCAFPSAGSSRP